MTKNHTAQLGQAWEISVDASIDVNEVGRVAVDFIGPDGTSHTVLAIPDGNGSHKAALTMTAAGQWSATVRVPGKDEEAGYKAAVADPEAKPARPRNIDEILAEVGEDAAKAAAELETEQARGDSARSTLVAQLQKIADPAGTS